MQEKTVRAMFMGHEIVARNVWGLANGNFGGEATLAIDGAVLDRSLEWSPRKATLRATLLDGGNSHAVEVLFGGIFTLRIKILVDGRKVAGDLR